jgi:PAS domain S-box-containing protein
MDLEQFFGRLEAMYARAAELQLGDAPPPGQLPRWQETTEALRTTMEELRVAEEELRQQNEQLHDAWMIVEQQRRRYQDLFDFAPDGYLVTDPLGVIREANHAASELLDVPADRLTGKPLANYIAEGQRRSFRAVLHRLGEDGKGSEFWAHLLSRRREPRDVSLTVAVARDAQMAPIALRWLVRDISERKRAEDRVHAFNGELERRIRQRTAQLEERTAQLEERTAQLEAANRAKDHFLAILSHELRTPLTPVLATISYCEGRPDLPAELRDEIASIRRNVELEARLIDDLLDITRISRGKFDLHREALDAHVMLRAALEVCQGQVEAKGLEVSLALRAKAHHVWADPARMQQVFWNLVQNAVKFTPVGGRISLRSTNVGEGRLVIQVADTGVGIEPEVLPRIFNAFEQGEQTVTRRYGGLGLGLTIARMLMDLHGGSLTAASAGRDRGATFTMELGTVPAPEDRAPPPELVPRMEGEALKILLVEDNPDTLRAISTLLRARGFVVRAAASAAAAFEATAGERFDLVVCDIGLPDGSGLDVMRHIRDSYGLKGIAFSGYGTYEDVRASREAGFEHHLNKPVNFGVLVDLIRRTAS